MSIEFDEAFPGRAGEPFEIAPGIVRVTAQNAGPLTFHGTNSYIVGETSVAVIDPGPDEDTHLKILLSTIAGRPVDAILLTHRHRDHFGLVEKLKAATKAPLIASARPPARDGGGRTDPVLLNGPADRLVSDGEVIDLPAATLEAVATPGHSVDHMSFALRRQEILFSGDHVMAWATTVIIPPEGSIRSFMASLDKLLIRQDRRYLPGHGGSVDRPHALVRALRSHRRMREAAIIERLRGGDRTIAEIVAAIYRTTDPSLHGAAGLSVLAHLNDLVERGIVRAEGAPPDAAAFELA